MHCDSRDLTGSGHVVPFGGSTAAHTRQHKEVTRGNGERTNGSGVIYPLR
jgi:hypothetical protein